MTIEQYNRANILVKAIRELEKALDQVKDSMYVQIEAEEWNELRERTEYNRIILSDTIIKRTRNYLVEQITGEIEEYKKELAEI